MAKYGKSAQKEVEKEMHRFKKGTAKSGHKLKKVKSREQAIAIGLSKARKKGAKVPTAPSENKTGTSKKKTTKPKTKRKSTVKKKPATQKKNNKAY